MSGLNKIRSAYANEGIVSYTFSRFEYKANKNGIYKKKPLGVPKDWQNLTLENYNINAPTQSKDTCIAILTGAVSNITILDFDSIDAYKLYYNKYQKEFEKVRTVKTNKGYHTYWKYNSSYKSTTNGSMLIDGVDILNDLKCAYAPPSSYIDENSNIFVYELVGKNNELLDLPKDLICTLKQWKNEEEIKIVNNKYENIEEEIKFVNKKYEKNEENNYLMIDKFINSGLLTSYSNGSYDDWIKIGMAMKHTSNSDRMFKLFDKFSLLSNKYNKETTLTTWNAIKNNNKNPVTIATLRKIVADNDKNKYLSIINEIQSSKCNSLNDLYCVLDDSQAVNHILTIIKDDIKYSNNQYFIKCNNIWITGEKEVHKCLTDMLLSSNIRQLSEKEKEKPYLQNMPIAKRVAEGCMNRIQSNSDNSFYNKLHTSTKGKLCFKNGVLSFVDKLFIPWTNKEYFIKNPIYSVVCIDYDYTEDVSYDKYKLDVLNFFTSILDEQSTLMLKFLSRSFAGHFEDKDWGIFLGNRDCGKGILDGLLKRTFGKYTSTLPSSIFKSTRLTDGGDETKKLSYLIPLQFVRLTTTQESDTDKSDKSVFTNGVKIKSFCSGGDLICARKNFCDEITFYIESKLLQFLNDTPNIKPLDTLETLVQFYTTKQFKKSEYIENERARLLEEIKEGKSEQILLQLDRYREANEDLKTIHINSYEWWIGLIRLLLDNYCTEKLTIKKNDCDDNESSTLHSKIFEYFTFTKNKDDKITNEQLKNIYNEMDISDSPMKIRLQLKSLGALDYRTNNTRGLSCIKVNIKECLLLE
jgi:hypothetical protein